MFSCEYCKIFKNTFFIEHLRGCFWTCEQKNVLKRVSRFCEILYYHFDDLKYIYGFNIIDIAVA